MDKAMRAILFVNKILQKGNFKQSGKHKKDAI